MLYFTGDFHGRFRPLIEFIEENKLNENDTIIVLGDMGLFWRKDGKDADLFIKNYEERYSVNIYFIDGNHENFDMLNKLEDKEGTPFKRVSDHIAYIPRGIVFEMNGKTMLSCGGADSVDRGRRIPHFTWWEQEQITDEDIDRCIENARGKHIDYILTHCCPLSVFNAHSAELITLEGIDQSKVDHTSEEKLERLSKEIDFGQWLFGHYHIDKDLDDKNTCLFNEFRKVD